MMPKTIERWHQLIKEQDVAGLDGILADDVVFHSPVVHTPQEGKQITTLYLTAAFHVLAGDDFQYVREVYGEHDAILEFSTTIGDIHINGVDLIHWNDEGQISDFKVMLRPLKAVNLVHRMMGQMLHKSKD